MDARPADPASYRQRRSRLFHHLVSGRDFDQDAGQSRRASLGDRGQLRDRQKRIRARPQRNQVLAWLASSCIAGHARLCHDGCHPASGQQAGTQKNQVERNTKASGLIRWSIQEIRRIAQRLARRRIRPANVIAWSLWRRAHQAVAQKSHFKKSQL